MWYMVRCPLNRAKSAQSVFWRIRVGWDGQEGCLKKGGSAEGWRGGREAEMAMGTTGWGKYREPK